MQMTIFESQINRHKSLVSILNPPSSLQNVQWFTQSVLLVLFVFFFFFFLFFFCCRQITFNCNWNAIFAIFVVFFLSFSQLKVVNLRIEIRNVAGYIFLVVKTFCNCWSSSDLRWFFSSLLRTILIHSQFKSKNILSHQKNQENGIEKLSCKSGTGTGTSTRISLYTLFYQLEFYEWISIWFK